MGFRSAFYPLFRSSLIYHVSTESTRKWKKMKAADKVIKLKTDFNNHLFFNI